MNNTNRLALFDLDHTLLPLDSDYQWAHYLAVNGHIGDPQEALKRNDDLMDSYNAGTLSADESYAFMLGLLTYASIDQLNQWHKAYMQAVVAPAIQPAALELVQKHMQQGDLCAIVTATNEFVTTPIAKAFDIEHLVATVAEVNNGKYTGKVQGIPCYQEGKIDRVNEWLDGLGHSFNDFTETWFYSDSINDLPLLEVVSHPIATNPSPALREIALERQWQIIDLFSTMADTKS